MFRFLGSISFYSFLTLLCLGLLADPRGALADNSNQGPHIAVGVYQGPQNNGTLYGDRAANLEGIIIKAECGNDRVEPGEDCESALLDEDLKVYCNVDCQWEFPEGQELCIEEKLDDCYDAEQTRAQEILLELRALNTAHDEYLAAREEIRRDLEESRTECLDMALEECAPEEREPELPAATPMPPKLPEQVTQTPVTPVAFAGSGCSLQWAPSPWSPTWAVMVLLSLFPLWRRRK